YPLKTLGRVTTWQEGTRASVKGILKDPIVGRLLSRSNLTRAQFETLIMDQLGHDMANKQLTRGEMAQLVRNQKGISRGALNRTLRQGRENVSEANLLRDASRGDVTQLTSRCNAGVTDTSQVISLGDLRDRSHRLMLNADTL